MPIDKDKEGDKPLSILFLPIVDLSSKTQTDVQS